MLLCCSRRRGSKRQLGHFLTHRASCFSLVPPATTQVAMKQQRSRLSMRKNSNFNIETLNNFVKCVVEGELVYKTAVLRCMEKHQTHHQPAHHSGFLPLFFAISLSPWSNLLLSHSEISTKSVDRTPIFPATFRSLQHLSNLSATFQQPQPPIWLSLVTVPCP